ncbi:MAG: hypothetical protein BM564_06360 [Bacteroidetes bacterium MedPE-SWsnd-G2]|nr:MAG: hypothetical protein BM564_06360 [Bacteroidetes bacterium MedPE-SWsnd-G2]
MKLKHVKLILIFLLCLSCGTNQTINSQKNNLEQLNCPQDGYCKIQTFRNSTLKITEDKFGHRSIDVKRGENIVVQFLYKRNEIPNTMDSGYSEIVYLELNESSLKDNTFKNIDLNQVNAQYGRFCYCKDATGFYPISVGELNLAKIDDNSYSLYFEYNTLGIPQITSEFQTVILNNI